MLRKYYDQVGKGIFTLKGGYWGEISFGETLSRPGTGTPVFTSSSKPSGDR